jgi:hypothetical protein
MFMDQFIDDNSSSREAAISEKMTSDSGYISAINLNERINEFNRTQQEKENKEQQKTNKNSYGGILKVNENGQISIEPADGDKTIKSKEKTASELLNVPDVDSGLSSNAKDLEKSSYYNFNENTDNYAKGASDSAATYLNLSSLIESDDIPNIKEYINYLNHYTHGGKPTTEFNKFNIEAAHKALLNKKIITASKYSENAPLQLYQLIKHVDNETKNNNNIELVTARSNYESYSKYYVEATTIKNNFDAEFSKDEKKVNKEFFISKDLDKYVKKDKNNQYQFITAEEMLKDYNKVSKGLSELYGINVKPKTPFPPASLLQKYIDGTIQGQEIKTSGKLEGDDPRSPAVFKPTYSFIIVDPNTKVKYDIQSFIQNYGTAEKIAEKRKEFNDYKGLQFNKYIKTNGGLNSSDWIMSRTLTYRNNPDDAIRDRSTEIALEAITENKGTVIKGSGGVIKPANFKKLADDSYEDEMTKVLEMLFNNKENLNASLISTDIKYQGAANNSAFVKLNFKLKNLQENLIIEGKGKAETERLKKAIQVLNTNGLEFNVSKNLFRKFAKDNYMQNIITENLLKGKGLTATDYERTNFHYDYKLTLGVNDKMLLTYKIKSYDPELEEWKEEEKRLEYSKTIGIDNILKDVRELGVANGYNINMFLKDQTEQKQRKLKLEQKQQKEKNAPNLRQPGESLEDWKKRIELQGKKMYKE